MKMSKIIVLGVIVAVFLATFVVSSFADSIGFIDVSKVFREYKKTEDAEDKLKKAKDDFEKEFKEAQDRLDKAERDKKTIEEIEKLKKELEEKLEPKKKELVMLNETLTAKLQADIISSVEKVSKKLGIDIVVDKQVIITGGVDLTEMVIVDINK